MFQRQIAAAVLAGVVALSSGPVAGSERFTPYPRQLYDVDQPGPRGDVAVWSFEPPAEVSAIRTCAMVISLDPHRLFAPAFSVVLIAGDEVLRLRFINENRRSDVLPAYLRRERADDPEVAVLAGSRKRPSQREVRMQGSIRVGEPFDLGLTWAQDGKVDVMLRTQGREEHILVPMLSEPTRIRVISSSGYWRLSPFFFGTVQQDAPPPNPDAADILSPPGCPWTAATDLTPAVSEEPDS